MKNFFLIIWLALAAVSTSADSLLPEQADDLFAPHQIRVGDLVTVVIENDVRTVQQVQVQNQSNSGISNPLTNIVGAITGITPDHEDQSARNETANTRSQFSETVTATVTEVERGNLTLRAVTSMKLDGKKREISLTGKVRRRDVGADNRVSSTLLADAIINVDGVHKSPVQPGIVSRVLRFLF